MRNVYLTRLVSLTFILMLWSVSHAQAEEVPAPPSTVVRQWLHSYPHDLAQAVTLTSPDFRENLPPSDWINQKQYLLNPMQFRYVESQILREEINGNRALIEVKVWISTVVGEQIQREQYDLRRYCSVWLLEKVSVREERFLGQTM